MDIDKVVRFINAVISKPQFICHIQSRFDRPLTHLSRIEADASIGQTHPSSVDTVMIMALFYAKINASKGA